MRRSVLTASTAPSALGLGLCFSLCLGLVLGPRSARAEEASPALGFVAGAATHVLGAAIGGALIGASRHDAQVNNAGVLTMDAGFALAPLVAHGAVGEWGRGALFSVVPVGTFAATGIFLAAEPAAVENGPIEQQRVLWSLLGAGLIGSLVGVIDVAFAGERVQITPRVTAQEIGVGLSGVL
jgi:hypothetical protein